MAYMSITTLELKFDVNLARASDVNLAHESMLHALL